MNFNSKLFKKLPDKELNQFYGGADNGTAQNVGTQDVQTTSTKTTEGCTDTKTVASGDNQESECVKYECPW